MRIARKADLTIQVLYKTGTNSFVGMHLMQNLYWFVQFGIYGKQVRPTSRTDISRILYKVGFD